MLKAKPIVPGLKVLGGISKKSKGILYTSTCLIFVTTAKATTLSRPRPFREHEGAMSMLSGTLSSSTFSIFV